MGFFNRTNPDRDLHERGRTARYDLVLIRGAPGVGKSTLSENLKKHFPDGASVEVDYIRGMINRVEWIHAQQDIHGVEAAWAACRAYLANGYNPVMLFDTFGIPKYKKIVSLIHASRPALSYLTIALYCTDGELISRITQRKNGFSDRKKSLLLNEEVRNHRHRNETFIDTTGRSTESVLNEVLKILQ
jgi:predicted kinase